MTGTDHARSPATPGRPPLADRYALDELLGRGAMADVYSATDRVLGRAVAVKIFRTVQQVDADNRRVDAETRTLASLSHPGLVSLFDAGTARDSDGVDVRYLVMELVDGPTLDAFRADRALAPWAVARIGRELAEALAYIHAAGVIHRDIKPANILVVRPPDDGRQRSTKLADFGIARVVGADRLTEHGTTVGTAHYLSPEQATGTVATGPASDIYSLGLVLIECLTGRMVFEGSAVAAAVARLHRDPVVPAELGPEWVGLLTAMTARLPQHRPTAHSVAVELAGDRRRTPAPATALFTARMPLVEAETETIPVDRSKGIRAWMVVAGIVAAAVIALSVFWAVSGDDPAPGGNPTPSPSTAASTPATTSAPVSTAPPTTPPETSAVAPVPPAPAAPAAPAIPAPVNPQLGNGNSGDGNAGNGNGNNGNGNNGNGNGNGSGKNKNKDK